MSVGPAGATAQATDAWRTIRLFRRVSARSGCRDLTNIDSDATATQRLRVWTAALGALAVAAMCIVAASTLRNRWRRDDVDESDDHDDDDELLEREPLLRTLELGP